MQCNEEDCLCRSVTFMDFLLTLNKSTELTNKQRRFRAYREAARALEYGAREPLAPCVEEKVKKMFPDAVYTGYQAVAVVYSSFSICVRLCFYIF